MEKTCEKNMRKKITNTLAWFFVSRDALTSQSSKLYFLWVVSAWFFVSLSLQRLVYFFWNHDFFESHSVATVLLGLAYGARFDASTVMLTVVILLPFYLLMRWRAGLYVILAVFLVLSALGLIANWIDIELIRFTSRRLARDGLFLLGESGWKARDIASQYGVLIVAGIAFLVAAYLSLIFSLRALASMILRRVSSTAPKKYYLTNFVLWMTSLFLIVLLARGGGPERSLPLEVIDAPAIPQIDLLALNTPFVFYKSLVRSRVSRVHLIASDSEVLSILQPLQTKASIHLSDPPKNVVVLVMESLSYGFLGKRNGVKGFTPFLDALIDRSLFFDNAYTNRMGSISGVPAVLGSMPGLGDTHYLESSYASLPINGLGHLFPESVDKAFFHGAKRTTMHFDQFSVRAGFNRHYALEDYPDHTDFDGGWGIYDKPYFAHVAHKLETLSSPFVSAVFSLSAHPPYALPDHERKTLPAGALPLLASIAYSDRALQTFFDIAKTKPWYKDTLFVVTADHGQMQYLPNLNHDLGMHHIPVLFFQEGRAWPAEVDRHQAVSQIDIVPTIVTMMGLKQERKNYLAHSLLERTSRPVIFRLGGIFYVVTDEHFLVYPLTHTGALLYDLKDPQRQKPLNNPVVEKKLTEFARAYHQYFNNGVLDRRLFRESLN